MNCSQNLIESYVDGELDAVQEAGIEQHLTDCQACSDAEGRLRRQKAAIQAVAPYYSAPPGLRGSIHSALQRVDAERIVLEPWRRPIPGRSWRWATLAASLLLAASLSWNVVQSRSNQAEREVGGVVTAHVQSLIGDHLTDVKSSDQHTVKPWFAGKLDFSPEVKDFAVQGFPLAGGRVDYLGGRTVAVLIYHRRQHVINLFVWPADSTPAAVKTVSRNGYNMLTWTDGSMTYWAVSDVSAGELENFRMLFEK